MQRLLLLSFFFIIIGISSASAQKLSVKESPIFSNILTPVEAFFFLDEEAKVIFIDFNKVEHKINTIKVLDDRKQAVLDLDVSHLGSDHIHELDYREFKKGEYSIQIITEDKKLNQSFKVLP